MRDEAVLPRYTTDRPNERVLLYRGSLRLTWEERAVECVGSIDLRWEPFPRLVLECELDGPAVELDLERPVDIEAIDGGGKGKGRLLGLRIEMNSQWKQQYTGVVWEFLVGSPAPTAEVVFHVPNFPRYHGTFVQHTDTQGSQGHWAGRLDISTDGWPTVLDLISRDTSWWDQLGAQGGYGLTHVGRVTRTGTKPVRFEDLKVIQPVLKAGLSLLRSERTSPTLFVGIHDGESVWELWTAPEVAPWFGPHSWMPHTQLLTMTLPTDGDFHSIFQALTAALGDQVEWSGLTRAITWYTQGIESRFGPAATKVIFAQAGLELMSWMRLVKDEVLDADGFRKLDAADALRLALELIGVQRDVPSAADELFAATRATSKGLKELDGPATITEIRNGSLHPEEKQRLSTGVVINQGAALASRYLELLLLRRLGYAGQIRNRATDFGPEPAPWSD